MKIEGRASLRGLAAEKRKITQMQPMACLSPFPFIHDPFSPCPLASIVKCSHTEYHFTFNQNQEHH
jgi:hypothetical protein